MELKVIVIAFIAVCQIPQTTLFQNANSPVFFPRQLMVWFNATNNTSLNSELNGIMLGLFKQSLPAYNALRWFNCTLLYMADTSTQTSQKIPRLFCMNFLIRLILNIRLRNLNDSIYLLDCISTPVHVNVRLVVLCCLFWLVYHVLNCIFYL